jgi:hypothetical protein
MRRALALLALALLAVSAGCTAFGGGSVDEGALADDVDHDWNTTADATVVLQKNRYRAVFNVSGTKTIELYRPRRLSNREPLDPVGLDFRHANGTVVNLTKKHVNRSGGATVVRLPAANGSVAFEANRQGKSLRLPTAVNGSYEVVLPPGGRVEYPFLGRVVPLADETSMDADGRVHIRWDAPDRNLIAVEYYLARDLLILGAIVAVGGVALLGGSVYYLITIRNLRRRREDVDIDLGGGDS